jgi:hypothetical protein
LTSLVKKLNAATEKNSSAKMGSFVVFCNEDDKLPAKLKDLAKKEDLKHTILTVFGRTGPDGYDVAKDADVTVVLYVKRNVKVNRVFKKGELKDADVDAILKDLSKILPEKKDK